MKLFLLFLLFSITSAFFQVDSSSSSSSSSEEHHKSHKHHESRGWTKGSKGSKGSKGPKGSPTAPPKSRNCPSGWLTFDRPQGRWCIAVFSGKMNQPAAEQQCQSKGATLTGVQNSEERMRLADECRRFQRANGLPDGSMWLGAHRKATCNIRALCAPHDAFEWTDGHTTGLDGWGFANAQPDGGVIDGVSQDCVHLISYVNGPIGSFPTLWPGMFHNNMDDMHCTIANSYALYYACGKRP